ncbi:MAG: peptidoglycan DD-metalloendopeptidase family protein, partial [Syntrophaceae bacterium]|nr:peptidoglycan DD-metalloendopeptidase family protein [Syntrophaceae bacterium]
HLFAGNNRVASVFLDGTTQFYHTNHLGSASIITDGYGNRKERMEYFPFGTYREAIDYDTNFPDVFYTFTGQEEDDELGLYNYNARLYDPVLGRFISPDRLIPDPADPQSLNRYTYCLNNPLIYTDPSGEIFGIDDLLFAVIVGVSAGLGAASGAYQAHRNGGNIFQGALIGAVIGAVSAGAGIVVGGFVSSWATSALTWVIDTASPLYSAAISVSGAVGGGFAGGAVAGGLNAAVYGGNVWQGALYGGLIGAAIAGTTAGAVELNNWVNGETGGTGSSKIASQEQMDKYKNNHGIKFSENPDWPTSYRVVTQGYKGAAHTGIDIRNPYGSASWATEEGIVIEVGPEKSGINRVMIKHEGGYVTKYYHQTPLVRVGDIVQKGQVVGWSEFWPKGSHLHFELSVDGSKFYSIDPLKYYFRNVPYTFK